ncbi:hypothetical protein FE374_18500 [Georgenia yuyongxinii]|uniref:DUF5655 domain-containing protein n=1 Tax=Georgenia yuyongxinii TaxID=2589797 RepID=A0A5B8CA85_9MICO|nr:DUF5655 domain-containing protein [Georgenia yuyongxinii]QDC26335.1 hypothetical protein FE374_18500 [Georgenia yuyongxinii]
MIPEPRTAEEFFDGADRGLRIHVAVAAADAALGPHGDRVSRSQIAFRRRRRFAYVWRPDRYLRSDVPAVLSIAASERWQSARFTEVVRPSPRVWMHRLELREVADVDAEVGRWLAAAYAAAG